MKNVLIKETYRPLSIYEQNVLLPILMNGLEMKKGKVNAVTGKQILHGLRNSGLRVGERQVYRLINHIRTNDLIVGLMASYNGYYITSNEQELIDYEENLLARETAFREVRMSIKRQRRAMFKQIPQRQLQIF